MDMKVSILKCDFNNAFILLHAPIVIGEGGGVREGENFFFSYCVRAKLRKFQWIDVITLQILLKTCIQLFDTIRLLQSKVQKILLNPEHCMIYLAHRFMN